MLSSARTTATSVQQVDGAHAATDALGNPVRLLFGPGQRHDVTRSHELLDGLKPDAVIADKGYDADHLRNAIGDLGAEAVVPSRSNRKAPWSRRV